MRSYSIMNLLLEFDIIYCATISLFTVYDCIYSTQLFGAATYIITHIVTAYISLIFPRNVFWIPIMVTKS